MAVDHVLHPAVQHHHVRVAVEGQERRQRLHPGRHVTGQQHLRIAADVARHQRVDVAEAHRERRLLQEARQARPERDAVGAVVARARRRRVGGVDLLDVGVHDHVAGELLLAEVDPRLLQLAELPVQPGLTTRRLVVGRRRDHARPVRVGEVGVLPRCLALVRGQIAGRDHHLGRAVAHRVAVHVDVGDVVEAPVLLLLLEAGRHDRRVPQAHVLEGGEVVLHLRRVEIALPLEVVGRHVVQPVGLSGRVDVVLDVGLLSRRLRRLHPEPLHERRHQHSRQHRHQHPQADAHHRQHPAAPPDVGDEEAEGEHRDQDQQVRDAQLHVHVGVGRAVDRTPGRERELVAVEPVPAALHQRQRPQQDRHVGLHLRRHPVEVRVEADAAVQHVRHQRHDQHEDQRREQPRHDRGEERELEDVEPDVGVERRVLLPEVLTVREQDPLVPVRAQARPGHQGQEHRQPGPHPTGLVAHHLVVALDQVVVAARGPERRGDPLGQRQVPPAQGEEDHEADQGERHPGPHHRVPHARQVERVEPQVVGVDASHPRHRHQQEEHHHQRPGQDRPPPPGEARPPQGPTLPTLSTATVGRMLLRRHGPEAYRRPRAPRLHAGLTRLRTVSARSQARSRPTSG